MIKHRTEVVWDSLNPRFSKHFQTAHNAKIDQWMKFEVYDIDNEEEQNDLSQQDLIGSIEIL